MEQEVGDRTKMAYAAGLIDSDGAIYIQKNKRGRGTPCVSVAVSCFEVINNLFMDFGGLVRKSRNLPKWILRKNSDVFNFLNKIKEFLVEKQEIAESVLERDYVKCRELNKWTCQEKIERKLNFTSINEIWAYIAGFIDGDGHITIKKRNRDNDIKKRHHPDYSLEVGCGGTDFRATQFIADFFEKGSLKVRPHNFCVNGIRLDYKIRRPEEVKEFLEGIFSFLTIKKSNALIALEYIKGYKAVMGGNDRSIPEEQIQHRENCYQEMKLLQRRK
jgi:hypothetical protein